MSLSIALATAFASGAATSSDDIPTLTAFVNGEEKTYIYYVESEVREAGSGYYRDGDAAGDAAEMVFTVYYIDGDPSNQNYDLMIQYVQNLDGEIFLNYQSYEYEYLRPTTFYVLTDRPNLQNLNLEGVKNGFVPIITETNSAGETYLYTNEGYKILSKSTSSIGARPIQKVVDEAYGRDAVRAKMGEINKKHPAFV